MPVASATRRRYQESRASAYPGASGLSGRTGSSVITTSGLWPRARKPGGRGDLVAELLELGAGGDVEGGIGHVCLLVLVCWSASSGGLAVVLSGLPGMRRQRHVGAWVAGVDRNLTSRFGFDLNERAALFGPPFVLGRAEWVGRATLASPASRGSVPKCSRKKRAIAARIREPEFTDICKASQYAATENRVSDDERYFWRLRFSP